MPWQVKFFQNQRGDYPVRKFIIEQDEKTYAKILGLIKLLNNNGLFIRPPYVKKIINNIWELRITDKTQKTPYNEIKIALDRAKKII